MKRMARVTASAALSVVLMLGACSDAGPDPEEALITQDVAAFVADQTVDDLILMTSEAEVALRLMQGADPICERVGMTVRCQRHAFAGDATVTVSRDVTFYDANDAEQLAYDRLETASIHMVFDLEGTRTRGNMTVTIDRARDMWWTGLLGEETERTWNGTGSAAVNRVATSADGGQRTYDISSTTLIEHVVIAVPRVGTWPLSGTIAKTVQVEVVNGLGDQTTRQRTVVVTFNGTQFVPVVINGETFTLDLATREIVESDG
jgi:hypothetical protein